MDYSVRMIATLGVVTVLVMLVLGWAMAGRVATDGGASDVGYGKREEECASCECTEDACQRPTAD